MVRGIPNCRNWRNKGKFFKVGLNRRSLFMRSLGLFSKSLLIRIKGKVSWKVEGGNGGGVRVSWGGLRRVIVGGRMIMGLVIRKIVGKNVHNRPNTQRCQQHSTTASITSHTNTNTSPKNPTNPIQNSQYKITDTKIPGTSLT